LAGVMFGCGENAVSIGNPPPEPEFSVDNKSDPNYIIFSVVSAQGFMINWDFGNGKLSQNSTDTIYYPFADTYTVKLTVSNKGGAATKSKRLIVETTDPKICANQYYTMLSGGCSVASKTWKIMEGDSALGNGPPSLKDAFGNGTSSYNDPIGSFWWRSLLSSGVPPPGALDDEYIFGLKGFTYKNDCHGDFYFNWKWCNKLFGTTQGTYADTVHAYTPNNPATWRLDVDTVTPEDMSAQDSTTWKRRFFTDSATGKKFNLILSLSNNNYLGYCSGVSVYQILRINSDTMYLRHELADPDSSSITGTNRLEWRYLRLVAKK
jgi:hypothetical protein